MVEKKVMVRMECNDPLFNRLFVFELGETLSFTYGNGTTVIVRLVDGSFVSLVDTRYDPLVISDFECWCLNWLRESVNPNLSASFNIL